MRFIKIEKYYDALKKRSGMKEETHKKQRRMKIKKLREDSKVLTQLKTLKEGPIKNTSEKRPYEMEKVKEIPR